MSPLIGSSNLVRCELNLKCRAGWIEGVCCCRQYLLSPVIWTGTVFNTISTGLTWKKKKSFIDFSPNLHGPSDSIVLSALCFVSTLNKHPDYDSNFLSLCLSNLQRNPHKGWRRRLPRYGYGNTGCTPFRLFSGRNVFVLRGLMCHTFNGKNQLH